MSDQPIRLLIADDHPIVAAGVAACCERGILP
jgi:hypothetical protein